MKNKQNSSNVPLLEAVIACKQFIAGVLSILLVFTSVTPSLAGPGGFGRKGGCGAIKVFTKDGASVLPKGKGLRETTSSRMTRLMLSNGARPGYGVRAGTAGSSPSTVVRASQLHQVPDVPYAFAKYMEKSNKRKHLQPALAQKLAITMMPVAQFQVENPVDMKFFQRFYYKWGEDETWQFKDSTFKTRWRTWIGTEEMIAPRMQTAYQTYVKTLQTVQTFAQRINLFIQAQAQSSTLVSLEQDTPASLLAQLNQIQHMLKGTSQSMIVADPAILRSNQYLQNVQFYLESLVSGKTKKILPTSELSFVDPDKIWGFYLRERRMLGTDTYQAKGISLMDDLGSVEVKRLPVPSQLRIAVIDEDKAMRQAIARISNDPQATKWEVETFETSKQFLAKPDYMFYDVVIGDFVFGADKAYSVIPETLQKANFSGLVLSCSDANPAAWTALSTHHIDRHSTWFKFAQHSRKIGIDANLQLFRREINIYGDREELVQFKDTERDGSDLVPDEAKTVSRDTDINLEDLINKIKAAYWVKGGGDGYITNSGVNL